MRVLAVAALCAGCNVNPAFTCPAGDGLGSWEQLPAEHQPGARYAAVAAVVGDDVVVFGGMDATGVRGDGTRYLTAQARWTPLPMENAPAPRAEATFVVAQDALNTPLLVVFGGQKAGVDVAAAPDAVLDNGAIYDASVDRWTPLPSGGPSARYRAAGAFNRPARRAYVVGGLGPDGAPRKDAWELDFNVSPPRWAMLAGEVPLAPPRDARPFMAPPLGAAVLPRTGSPGQIVLVAPHGTPESNGVQARAATYVLPLGPWVMDLVQTAPPARVGAAVTLADNLGVFFVQGGHVPRPDPGADAQLFVDDLVVFIPPEPDPEAPLTPARSAPGTNQWVTACASGPDGGVVEQSQCAAASVSVPRAFHGATWTGDGLLVAGGVDPGSCGGAAFWDLATRSWRRTTFLQSPARTRLPMLVFLEDVGALAFGGHRPASLAGQPAAAVRWMP